MADNPQGRSGIVVRIAPDEREALRVVAVARGFDDGRGPGMARVIYEKVFPWALEEAARIRRGLAVTK